MSLITIVGFVFISASLGLLLKKYSPEYSIAISVAASAFLLVIAAAQSTNIIETVNDLASKANINHQYIKIMFKAVGVCYITQLTKDICKDAGETALAERVDVLGKISITVLSLPLVLELINIITELLA